MTINDFKIQAKKAVDYFEDRLRTLRTGRASTALVENIIVDAYGSKMPLAQLASISVPEPRQVVVSVWDKSLLDSVLQAIRKSDLGLSPSCDDGVIRINFPPMTEERRGELRKLVWKYAEEAKVALRNCRRDFLEYLDEQKKTEKLPEEYIKSQQGDLESQMKRFVDEVEQIARNKEQEIMTF